MQEDLGSLQLFLRSTRLGLDLDLSHDDVGHEDQGEEQDLAVWIEETAANYQDPLAPSCTG